MIKIKEARKNIKIIKDVIVSKYKPEKIILFGSYAYGKPSSSSDIDLFIIKKTKKNRRERFVEIKRMAYDPKREVVFSPIVYTPKEVTERINLEDDFVKEILTKGVVLYAKQN